MQKLGFKIRFLEKGFSIGFCDPENAMGKHWVLDRFFSARAARQLKSRVLSVGFMADRVNNPMESWIYKKGAFKRGVSMGLYSGGKKQSTASHAATEDRRKEPVCYRTHMVTICGSMLLTGR